MERQNGHMSQKERINVATKVLYFLLLPNNQLVLFDFLGNMKRRFLFTVYLYIERTRTKIIFLYWEDHHLVWEFGFIFLSKSNRLHNHIIDTRFILNINQSTILKFSTAVTMGENWRFFPFSFCFIFTILNLCLLSKWK